ncbi:MAG TPA: hypothetical protein VG758_01295 [Hyphomicrobiaceae bacterium]|jgi:hypothetical protein|nr:hypothetical protein [Hyphomicrobiaceae bacterium]
MSSTIEPLILDLVEWVAKEPRAYDEVMDAWRTSCPRLTVWEDAVDRGLVRREARRGAGLLVVATSAGHELLKAHRRTCGSAAGRVEGT